MLCKYRFTGLNLLDICRKTWCFWNCCGDDTQNNSSWWILKVPVSSLGGPFRFNALRACSWLFSALLTKLIFELRTYNKVLGQCQYQLFKRLSLKLTVFVLAHHSDSDKSVYYVRYFTWSLKEWLHRPLTIATSCLSHATPNTSWLHLHKSARARPHPGRISGNLPACCKCHTWLAVAQASETFPENVVLTDLLWQGSFVPTNKASFLKA